MTKAKAKASAVQDPSVASNKPDAKSPRFGMGGGRLERRLTVACGILIALFVVVGACLSIHNSIVEERVRMVFDGPQTAQVYYQSTASPWNEATDRTKLYAPACTAVSSKLENGDVRGVIDAWHTGICFGKNATHYCVANRRAMESLSQLGQSMLGIILRCGRIQGDWTHPTSEYGRWFVPPPSLCNETFSLAGSTFETSEIRVLDPSFSEAFVNNFVNVLRQTAAAVNKHTAVVDLSAPPMQHSVTILPDIGKGCNGVWASKILIQDIGAVGYKLGTRGALGAERHFRLNPFDGEYSLIAPPTLTEFARAYPNTYVFVGLQVLLMLAFNQIGILGQDRIRVGLICTIGTSTLWIIGTQIVLDAWWNSLDRLARSGNEVEVEGLIMMGSLSFAAAKILVMMVGGERFWVIASASGFLSCAIAWLAGLKLVRVSAGTCEFQYCYATTAAYPILSVCVTVGVHLAAVLIFRTPLKARYATGDLSRFERQVIGRSIVDDWTCLGISTGEVRSVSSDLVMVYGFRSYKGLLTRARDLIYLVLANYLPIALVKRIPITVAWSPMHLHEIDRFEHTHLSLALAATMSTKENEATARTIGDIQQEKILVELGRLYRRLSTYRKPCLFSSKSWKTRLLVQYIGPAQSIIRDMSRIGPN